MKRSEHWSRENLAWLSGIIEGEGCIVQPVKPGRATQVAVRVCMTDEDVVYRVAQIAGVGRVQKRVRPPSMAAHHKDQWVWQVQSTADSVALLYAILPWLGARRSSTVRTALAVWSSTPLPRRRTASPASSR